MFNMLTFTLGCLLLFHVTWGAPSPTNYIQHGCRMCPSGQGVSQMCTQYHDTVCAPCPKGYYSSYSSIAQPCQQCTSCGEGLYEVNPCTPYSDRECDLCAWADDIKSDSYLRGCLNSGKFYDYMDDGEVMMGDEAVAEAEDAGRPEAEEEPEGTTPWRPHMPGDVKKHEERDRFDKGLTMVELEKYYKSGKGPGEAPPRKRAKAAASSEENVEEKEDEGMDEERKSKYMIVVIVAGIGIVGAVVFFVGRKVYTKYIKKEEVEEEESTAPRAGGYETSVHTPYSSDSGKDGRGRYSGVPYKEPSTPDSIAEESEEEKDEVFPLRSVTVETKTPVVNQDAKVLPVRKTEPGLGASQSPIDLVPENALFDDTLRKCPLTYKYIAENTAAIVNTGTTVKVEVNGDGSLLQGGPLGDKRYRLDHFHFHWGGESSRGAEHTVNGWRSAAELHLVHWNTTDFETFEDAVKSEGGLAVLGVLLAAGGEEHAKMKVLTNKMASIPLKGETRMMPAFDPASVLPANTDDYWTYSGSLTTPPYYETVTWIVFRDRITVTEAQMTAFRNLYKGLNKADGAIVDNYREVQALGKRTIRASFSLVPEIKEVKVPEPVQEVDEEPALGRYQSPVDLIPAHGKFDESLKKAPLLYKYIADNTTAITNTGTTLKVEVNGDGSLLQGGPLGDKRYRLDHFHFHWGAESNRGAEHTVDGSRCASELHLVHWNTTDFDSFSDAVKAKGGLAVLGVLLAVGEKEHSNVKVLTDKMAEIPFKGESRTMPVFDPASILPDDTDDYWTYSGSLTTPPYYETVTWIVFRDPITVTEAQMTAFRGLYKGLDKSSGAIVDNYREVQPLGDRDIRASFPSVPEKIEVKFEEPAGKPEAVTELGRYQSPVDLVPEEGKFDESLKMSPLLYKYIAENTTSIVNTGTTLKVEVDGEGSLLEKGPLGNKRYRLDHFHFHWGGESSRGAEHTVNGWRSAAELHFVHWNTTDFATFGDAAKSKGGLAVLGVLLVAGGEEHSKIKVLADKMKGISYKGECAMMPPFDPASILPANTEDYWTYSGSLTTPPYSETVTWIVFRDRITVTEAQMQAFRSLHKVTNEQSKLAENGDGMLVDNYREVQPLGDRVIRASFSS